MLQDQLVDVHLPVSVLWDTWIETPGSDRVYQVLCASITMELYGEKDESINELFRYSLVDKRLTLGYLICASNI